MKNKNIPVVLLSLFFIEVFCSHLQVNISKNWTVIRVILILAIFLFFYSCKHQSGLVLSSIKKNKSSIFLFGKYLCISIFSQSAIYCSLFLLNPSDFQIDYFSFELLVFSALTAFRAGVFEEIIMRDLLMVYIYRKSWFNSSFFAWLFASSLQALVFAILHGFFDIYFSISALAFGMLLGGIFIYTGNIWASIGLHAGVDFVARIANGLHGKVLKVPGIYYADDSYIKYILLTLIILFSVSALYFWSKIRLADMNRIKDAASHLDVTVLPI